MGYELRRTEIEDLSYDRMTGIFIWSRGPRQGRVAGHRLKNGYIQIRVAGRLQYAHRIAWWVVNGYWPEVIDHVNRNRSDNRIQNLRDVSQKENCQNRSISSNNTSGVTGKSWNKRLKAWELYETLNGKKKYLGMLRDGTTPEEF